MATMWVPYKKAEAIGKRFLELAQKSPVQPFEKFLVVGGGRAVKGAYKLIFIVGVKKGKYSDGMKVMLERMEYYAEVEGVDFEIETYMSARFLLESGGLKMPG